MWGNLETLMKSSDSLLGWYPTVNNKMSFKGTWPPSLQRDLKGFLKKEKKKDTACSHEAGNPSMCSMSVFMYVVLPDGDTAPGSRGHAAATATAALSIRTPRVPVVWTGNLLKKNWVLKHSWAKMTYVFFF